MTLRTFTPLEANRTLPLVRRIVQDILALGAELRELVSRGVAGVEAVDHGHRLQARLSELMGELSEIGCDYKDWGFEMGLVDFPGFIEEHPVLLCWRSDEPAVEWYHAPEAGYAGRTRIPSRLLVDVEEARRS